MRYVLSLCAAAALLALAQLSARAAPADLRAGKQTYNAFCATCHGINANGDGPSAKWVKPLPRDFTACRLMSMYKDADLFKAIKDGGPAAYVSYNMPPWGAVLNDQQINNVLAYVRSFCAKTNHGAGEPEVPR
jgi:cytochrome c oxidase cbb3-type subunit III